MSKPAFNRLNLAPAEVRLERRDDGTLVLSSPQELKEPARRLNDLLDHWAEETPEALFLAERAPDGSWRKMGYAAVHQAARAVGQALLDRGLDASTPLAILSGNSIDVALLQLGAIYAGIPSACVSPAYSLLSKDFGKLSYIVELLDPSLVYAADGEAFAGALGQLGERGAEIVTSSRPPAGATDFAALLAGEGGAGLDAAYEQVGPDTVAKILFTSGSTGLPKGVLNTHRMLCSNQQAIAQLWPFLEEKPPLTIDWLPWSHTFGANHNFNMMLRNGGAYYIDEGKPLAALIEKTVANLREISPSVYFNVPRGFDMLIPYLEKDRELRDSFFKDLDLIFYAGAALPQNLWERLEELSVAARGERVRLVSAWGSTETSPLATSVHFDIEQASVIGLPAPGTAIKMVPNAGKLELRVKGPNVTPGYWKQELMTRKAFDEEGFYCIGDAGALADPEHPECGIVFNGRIAEDFKLMSGTWVHVGNMRLAAITAGAPVIQDCVVTGHGREDAGLLVFANPAGCHWLCPDLPADAPLEQLIAQPEVRQHLCDNLAAYNAQHPGSSERIWRVALMSEPPNIDANEITDKGYINQRAVLERRADVVERLYAATPDEGIIEID